MVTSDGRCILLVRSASGVMQQGRVEESEWYRRMTRPGRNDPCPCGSGKKYKRCCLPKEASAAASQQSASGLQTLQAALAYHHQGQLQQAESLYREALRVDPRNADSHQLLGTVLRDEGDLPQATVHFREALRLRPESGETHVNLGIALQEQGHLTEANAHFKEALRLNPENAPALNGLGITSRDQGDLAESIAYFQEALRLLPGTAEIHINLGVSLQEAGNVGDALAHYREAVRLSPGHPVALDNLVNQAQLVCDWSNLEGMWRDILHRIHSQPPAPISPHGVLLMPSTAEDQLISAGNWVATRLARVEQERADLSFQFVREFKSRLRIGYLSSDFHAHATAYLIAELFELHDRQRFEIVAYSIGHDDSSPIRRRLTEACDRFVDLNALSHAESARRIYADGVDILVDLKGYTRGSRTEVLALKPAPIQVNYLGYPGTMGADFIDYIITDRFVTPPDQQRYFTEQFVYLPDSYQVNDRKRPIAERTPTRAECGLPEVGFVFCCFNTTAKLNPRVFDIWMRLLRATSGSVLWLLTTSPLAVANLQREARGRGVESERLVFAPQVPLGDHLARHRLADLFLDTLPCNAHTTASDALWAGLPMLTCASETFASRVAGSLLSAVGLPELITTSLEEYEQLALQLAHAPSALAELRKKLAVNRQTMPLFDSQRFTRNLEAAYERMWESFVASAAKVEGLTV